MTHPLRVSGIVATLVFAAMVVSDLLMLTTLDFTRIHDYWADAPILSGRQVTWGYYLGELVIPFYCVAGWHLSLAVRPAGRWASWLVLGATAYSACLFAVYHASFAFVRSLLRAGAVTEASHAFGQYAVPLFRTGLAVSGVAYAVVLVLMAMGRTVYPRWALLVSPLSFFALLRVYGSHASPAASVLIGAGGWNLLGALSFAASTVVLWKHEGGFSDRQPSGAARQ